MPFWQFSREGWDGRVLLVQPSRIPRWIWKILFGLGSYEFVAMLEGKIGKGFFFYGSIWKNTVWIVFSPNFTTVFTFSSNIHITFMKFITMIIRAFYDYNYCKNKFEKKYEKVHNSTVLLEFRLIEITTMSSRYIS